MIYNFIRTYRTNPRYEGEVMRTIFLEFKRESGNLAANGSDIVFHLDGRWGKQRVEQEVYNRVVQLRAGRSKYQDQLFVGYTYSGHGAFVPLVDRYKPLWACEVRSHRSLWDGSPTICKDCGGDKFYDLGRSLDHENLACVECRKKISPLTETGMCR